MKERIHGMDALRGIAMWLGVVLHSVIAYQTSPRPGWPTDTKSSVAMDLIYDYLHAFRMPLFFLVAGYFAHFLYTKIGLRLFLKHRAKRILLPFLLSVLTIVPLCGYIFAIHRLRLVDYGGDILIAALKNLTHWTGFYHIWFLYYLMILYGIAIVYEFLLPKRMIIIPTMTEFKYFASTIVLFLIQLFFFDGHVEPWTGIIPKVGQILYFTYFFGLGYVIYNNSSFLFKHKNQRYCYVLIGIALVVLTNFGRAHIPYWLYSGLISIQTNLLILGHIAVFMHLFRKKSAWVRYFSDASYWFYLIHFPIVVILQMALFNIDVSVWLKCILVISVTTCFSIITYEYFVRYTWIGTILNGKKLRNYQVAKAKKQTT